MNRLLLLLLMGVLCGGILPAQQDDFKRERSRAGSPEKDALEGKAPPRLVARDWLNTGGRPLDLAALRGKVVVVDFWGTW